MPAVSNALNNLKDTASAIVSEGGRQLRATLVPSTQSSLPAEQRAMNLGSQGPAPPPPQTPAPPANWYQGYRGRSPVLGSFKSGGVARKAGLYRLHRGETRVRSSALAKAISKAKRKVS